MIKRIILLILLIFWGIVITSFSAQTGEESAGLSEKITNTVIDIIYGDIEVLSTDRQTELFETWHFIIRKCAHMTEYAIFSVLVSMFLMTFSWFSYRGKGFGIRMAAIVTVFCAVFAAFDEYHQSFVEGRGPSIIDVLIDTAGAVIGYSFLFVIIKYRKRRKKHAIS